MDLYIVQAGDTIEKIADRFGTSVEKIILDNELQNPNKLLIGQVIVIVYPSKTYIVKEGDTLSSIAASNNITVNELLRNNPFVLSSDYIYPGEELTIAYDRSARVSTYGYADTFINRETLRKTLPFLTYLSVFDYYIGQNGEVIGGNNDRDIIEMAIQHGVIPLLHLATITIQGEVDEELTFRMINDEELQDRIIENTLNILREKGYYGVVISSQMISSDNQELFYNYAKRFSDAIEPEGYITLLAIDPKPNISNGQITFEPLDYSHLSEVAYSILFIRYTWGIIDGPPSPVFSVKVVDTFLDTFLPSVDPAKLSIGMPLLGYIWELPYIPGLSDGNSITIENVLNLAVEYNVVIQFDEESQTPFFISNNTNANADNDSSGNDIIVWFVNPITFNSLLNLLVEKDTPSLVVWSIMSYLATLWLVINSQYEIIKLLPEF